MTPTETITSIKDAVAKKHGYKHWKELMYNMGRQKLEEYENEAFLEVANNFCKLQRESDYKGAKITNGEEQIDGHRCKEGTYVIDPESILTNPLVTEQ